MAEMLVEEAMDGVILACSMRARASSQETSAPCKVGCSGRPRPPDHLEDLYLLSSTHTTVDKPPDYLADEWISLEKLDDKDRQEIRFTSAR
jgi:hypothetical protein